MVAAAAADQAAGPNDVDGAVRCDCRGGGMAPTEAAECDLSQVQFTKDDST